MKKSFTMLLSLAAVATFASPVVARAQVSNPLKFTVFGGAALPSGDVSNDFKTGYTVGGAVDLRAPLMPVGLRGELTYSSLGAKDTGGLESLNMTNLGGNANAVFWMPSAGTPLTAYLTAGPSYGHVKVKASDSGVSGEVSQNKWGFNAGGGIDFGLSGLSTRLDVRYVQLSMDNGGKYKTVPITFGITF
ncbi:MAG TPA: outer membrane beta-barrel protein [Gemmatimonadaceae bacterium]